MKNRKNLLGTKKKNSIQVSAFVQSHALTHWTALPYIHEGNAYPDNKEIPHTTTTRQNKVQNINLSGTHPPKKFIDLHTQGKFKRDTPHPTKRSKVNIHAKK